MTLLVTAAEVVTYAFNDKNFLSAKILDTNIEIAQEALLRPALGDDLFEALIATTPTGDNKTLVDTYLKKAIAYYVKYAILPDFVAHVANTGLSVMQPVGTISASDKQVGLIREQAKENARILLKSAIRYIEDNSTKYPLYKFTETIASRTNVRGGVIF